jgi:hypothetical protein
MSKVINTALFKTVQECDAYGAQIQEEINSLSLDIQFRERSTNESTRSAEDDQKELAEIEQILTASQIFHDSLPEKSKEREVQEKKMSSLNHRKFILTTGLKEDDIFKVLDKQISLGKIQSSITVLNDTLADIAQRKAELTGTV